MAHASELTVEQPKGLIPGLFSGRLHYAWVVAAITLVVLVSTAGVRSMPGILIVPLEQEFGWNRAVISVGISINLLLYGLCGPFAAAAMIRFGIRKVVIAALLVVCAGVGLTTVMRAPWQLYLLWGLIVGIGTGSVATILAATVAGRWFVERRGLVVGVLTASNATGQLIFLPILASLVVAHGWRWASATVVVVLLAILPLAAILIRNNPRDVGLKAYGAKEADEGVSSTENPIAAAFRGLGLAARSRQFWLLAGSFFICGATTNGLIGTHLIPASMDHGIPEVTAASMLAVVGVFDIVGTTVSGWLTDRWDSRWLLFAYYGLRGLSLLLLPFVLGSSFLGLMFFIVFYGLDWVATVPPTVAITADVFGRRNMAIVYGWIFASHQLGSAFAAGAGGALRVWLGDYQVTFITAGLLCLIAAGLVIRISSRGRSDEVKPQPAPVEAPASA
jgi:MFS family permease